MTYNRLDEANIWSTCLSSQQVFLWSKGRVQKTFWRLKHYDVMIWNLKVQALLSAMCHNRQLKRINLGGNSLLSVPDQHIGQGLLGLAELGLESTYLTTSQLEILSARYVYSSWIVFIEKSQEVLVRMSESGGTELLNLSQNNLSLVPELPLSSVLSKMKEVCTRVGEFRLFWPFRQLNKLLIQKENLNGHLERVLC